MLYKLPTIVFYPVILVWSIFYGGIAGFIFKILQAYENWVAINQRQLGLWKRYPQRSYRKYIESMWAQQLKGKPVELVEYDKIQLEKSHPEEPFPLFRIMLNSVFMVFLTPFMALSGLYYGPIFVFTRLTAQHHRYINKSVME